MHVIEAHLSPRHSAQRMQEAEVILEAVASARGEPVLMLADCNNVLPSSASGIDEPKLIETMRGVWFLFLDYEFVDGQW